MLDIQTLLTHYGDWFVFLNVLADQAGLPIPAYPMLIAAGSLTDDIGNGLGLWMLALSACLLADSVWYLAGSRYGERLLRLVCKVSLSRDSCIRQTHKLYLRVGARSLLVGKFLPGAGALSTVMAGMAGTPYWRFLLYDLAGSLIWTGSALLLGVLFRDAVEDILALLVRYGPLGLALIALVLLAYVLLRGAYRWSLVHRLRHIPRLKPDELLNWCKAGCTPVLLDARPGSDVTRSKIPGAIAADLTAPLPELPPIESSVHIVIYCSCPDEISAARLGARLRAAGYANVWALHGGYDAWARMVKGAETPIRLPES